MSRIRKTFIAVFLGRGIMAVRQIIILPIMIHHWGADYYGKWLMISSIPSFLSMSNLGLGSAASIRIAILTARGLDSDRDSCSRLLSTSLVAIASIATAVCTICLIWMHFAPIDLSFPHSGVVLILLLLSIFLRMLAQPIHGWWTGVGNASKSLQINNHYSIGELFVYLALPAFGFHALALSLAVFCWTFLWLIYFICRSSAAGCDLWKNDQFAPSFAMGKDLISEGIGFQLSPLWQGLFFQGSVMIAGTALGPTGAAMWGALRIVARSGNQLMELVSQSLGPEFQIAYGKGKIETTRRLHSRGLLICFTMSILISLGLMLLGANTFAMWTSHQFDEPPDVWFVLPISLIPFSLWWISAELQRSMNRPWAMNLWGVISATISLLCMWIFSSQGVLGLSYGALVFELVMVSYILPRSLHLLGDSLFNVIKEAKQEIGKAANFILELVRAKGK